MWSYAYGRTAACTAHVAFLVALNALNTIEPRALLWMRVTERSSSPWAASDARILAASLGGVVGEADALR